MVEGEGEVEELEVLSQEHSADNLVRKDVQSRRRHLEILSQGFSLPC